MKGLKILINIILDLLILILVIGIGIALYGFIQVKVLNKTYSNYFGYTYFQILTGSMEETIKVDDIVFVRVTREAKKNDIISYEKEKEIITHRIIEVNDEGYITKGDNNNTDDGLIKKEQVIGKVVYIGKGYGKVKKFVTEPIVLIPFIAVIAFFSWYMAIVKKERSMEDEE